MYINIKYVHQYIEAHLGSEKHRRNETDPAVQGVHVGDWAGSFVIVAVKCRLEKNENHYSHERWWQKDKNAFGHRQTCGRTAF